MSKVVKISKWALRTNSGMKRAILLNPREIVKYLPEGKVTTEWQKAVIPFSEFNVDYSKLASIVIAFETDCYPEGSQQGVVISG